MTNRAAQLRAKVLWDAACERVAFALAPVPGMDPDIPPALQDALRVARNALAELEAAFCSEASPNDQP